MIAPYAALHSDAFRKGVKTKSLSHNISKLHFDAGFEATDEAAACGRDEGRAGRGEERLVVSRPACRRCRGWSRREKGKGERLSVVRWGREGTSGDERRGRRGEEREWI